MIEPLYDALDMVGAMFCGGMIGAAIVMLACWHAMRKDGAR